MVNHIKISPSLSLPRNTPHSPPSPGSVVDHAADLKRISHYSFLVPSCHYLQSSLSYSWRPLAVPSAIRSGWNISISAGWGRGQFLCNIGPGIQRHQAVSSSHLIRQQIHHAEYCFIQHPPPAASSSCLTDHSCSWSHRAGEETRLFCPFCPSSDWFLAPQKIQILDG